MKRIRLTAAVAAALFLATPTAGWAAPTSSAASHVAQVDTVKSWGWCDWWPWLC